MQAIRQLAELRKFDEISAVLAARSITAVSMDAPYLAWVKANGVVAGITGYEGCGATATEMTTTDIRSTGLPQAPSPAHRRHSQRKPAAYASGPEQRHIEIRGLTSLPERCKTLPHISNDAVVWKMHEAGTGRFKPPDFPGDGLGIV